tara:strand:- start:868 stop:1050 length:183 start_codon:yes stop_codon:yes gene_type:complete
MIVYVFWLLMVILWNYGAPNAAPIEDVSMAVIIGFIAYKLKKVFPDPAILKKNKYFGNKK